MMNQNTTLFLGLALVILLNSSHAVIENTTEPQSEMLKFELTGCKVAVLSPRNNNSIVYSTKNSTIINVPETIKDSEKFLILPLNQIIKMKNNYDEVLVDLIRNMTSLKCNDGEEIEVEGPNDHYAMLSNECGTLRAVYDQSLMMCESEPWAVYFERNKLTLMTEISDITYDQLTEIVIIDGDDEYIEIDLKHRNINGTIDEELFYNTQAWRSYGNIYGSVYSNITFDNNSALIVYDDVNLTINLTHKPYLVVMRSLRVNLTETPTSVTLECDAGKIEMKRNDETMKSIQLTSINGQVGFENRIVLNENSTIITSAEQRTVIIKSQKENTPLSIRGMYSFMRILQKSEIDPSLVHTVIYSPIS